MRLRGNSGHMTDHEHCQTDAERYSSNPYHLGDRVHSIDTRLSRDCKPVYSLDNYYLRNDLSIFSARSSRIRSSFR